MKKNNLIKAIILTTMIVCSIIVLVVPAAAAETTTSPQIQFNSEFNANTVIKTVFNWLVGIIALIGAGIGGWHIASGSRNQDQKELVSGIVTIVISLAVGALMLVILNMVLV